MRLKSRTVPSALGADREEAPMRCDEASSSEERSPPGRAGAIRNEELPECTPDCASTVSVVQAAPSQPGDDPQRRSWTSPERAPHGAAFDPGTSTASVLVVNASPVTPHAYCASGAPTLRSSASATSTRVFSNVRASSLMGGSLRLGYFQVPERQKKVYDGVSSFRERMCALYGVNEEPGRRCPKPSPALRGTEGGIPGLSSISRRPRWIRAQAPKGLP